MENYKYIEQICEGQQGKIWKVQRVSDNQTLVSKELNYGEMTEKQKQQLIQEVNILRELKHPNIVRYYDRFFDNQRILDKKQQKIYIIMEYCEKGDLQQYIEKQKLQKSQLEEDIVWKFIIQITLALNELHNHKSGTILHRDIKPANIFLDNQDNFKLGDFGFCKQLVNSNFTQTLCPQLPYPAPEQLSECIFTASTDIWSFVCTIHHLLFLNSPFPSNNPLQIALRLRDKFEIPECSTEIRRIIEWGLERESKKRISIQDLTNLWEVNFYIRQKRLKDGEKNYQDRRNRIVEVQKDLFERENRINQQRIQLKNREDEILVQNEKLQNIYDESLKEYEVLINNQNLLNPQKGQIFRNNSQDTIDSIKNNKIQNNQYNLSKNTHQEQIKNQQVKSSISQQLQNHIKQYELRNQNLQSNLQNNSKEFSSQFLKKLQNINQIQSPQNLINNNKINFLNNNIGNDQQQQLKNKYLQRPQTSTLFRKI